ncbi:MAG TPA: SCO family protein [Gemmatimonadaceae bacterium]
MRRLLPLSLAALALAAGCSRSPDVRAHAAAAGGRGAAAADAAEERYSVYGLHSRWHDQAGDTLRLPALAGRVRVVAFVYTSCHTTCPLILRDLKAIEAALPASRRDDVGFVLVSIDPERDTPGRLAEWGADAQLDLSRWTLLSGADDAVRELAVTLGVSYQALPDGEVAHTNAITVLDAEGIVAHRRPGLDEPIATTASAIARALE